jgi:dipeptidyl aminopeptidase/acylaminoacyl peptidase
MPQVRRVCSLLLGASLVVGAGSASSPANEGIGGEPTGIDAAVATVDRILARATFPDIQVTRDGQYVAYIYTRARAATDEIEIWLNVAHIGDDHDVQEVAHYVLPASTAIRDSTTRALADGVIVPSAAGFRWVADRNLLLYISHASSGPQISLFDPTSGRSSTVLENHEWIRFVDSGDPNEIVVTTSDLLSPSAGPLPPDRALRMTEGYTFFDPFENPGSSPPYRGQPWRFDATRNAFTQSGPATIVRQLPAEWPAGVPDSSDPSILYTERFRASNGGEIKHVIGVAGESMNDSEVYSRYYFRRGESSEYRRISTAEEDHCGKNPLGWNQDGTRFFYIARCFETFQIRSFRPADSSSNIVRRLDAVLAPGANSFRSCDEARRTCVMSISRNLQLESLVRVDLASGRMTTIASPNEPLPPEIRGIRVVRLRPSDELFGARLYLPNGRNRNLPMVITLYGSTPGFETSGGDEVPIQALVRAGFAVMTLKITQAGMGIGGDPLGEVARLERPVRALRELIDQASRIHGIDRARVGLSGVSYGAEVSMYAYWRSGDFRAISAATGSVVPSWVFLGGLNYSSFLARRGLIDADRSDVWQRISAGLNARPDLPPLLWQSPEEERLGTVESWFYLRQAGAQVEWLEYADEQHVKYSPANRWWVLHRNMDWFRFWLQDYEDPDPAKAEQYARWRAMRAALSRNGGS